MKFNLLSPLPGWVAAHKKLAILAGVILLAALVAGGIFGFREYQYRQSANYAFEQLREALNPPKPDQLARLVDFNAIGNELARAIKKSFPFYLAGKDQERNIRNRLQNALLRSFMQKDEKKAALPDLDDQQALLQVPLEIMPADFVSQLRESLVLREAGERSAILMAKIDQPLLGRSFTPVLGLDKTASGWKVDKVLNADELLAQLREAMLQRHVKLRNVYEHKNMLTSKRMDSLLPVQSCSVHAGLLSDGKTLVMTVQVIGRNKGNVQINNFNVDASIMGKNGKLVAQRFLNVAKPVAPGEDFNHRWNFELESDSPLARAIMQNQPLQCAAKWQTLGLNNSEVLHILEVPNPDAQCSISGHNHPDGFCLTPVFQD